MSTIYIEQNASRRSMQQQTWPMAMLNEVMLERMMQKDVFETLHDRLEVQLFES
jgi:hypothetical protein